MSNLRPRPKGSRTVAVDLVPPSRAPNPSREAIQAASVLYINSRNQLVVNWRHRAFPLIVLLVVVALPLTLLKYVTDNVRRLSWVIEERVRRWKQRTKAPD